MTEAEGEVEVGGQGGASRGAGFEAREGAWGVGGRAMRWWIRYRAVDAKRRVG